MWLFISAAVVLLSASTSAKVVDTAYGSVDGNTVTLDDGTVINSWYGIPYAQPPLGDLRFAPPQDPEPWDGVLEAKSLPDACIQSPAGLLWLTHPGWNNYSEDCLKLNLYAPEDLTGEPLPVMVWFHGGGYTSGANIQYPGHFLAARGVVVVVPNYRLDAFGFLATPDGTVRGNMGLLDQWLSLTWVHNTIRAFGGDPNKVTIFGQSAGAGSSSMHLVSPASQGLFHQAILESGADSNLWALNYPGQEPEKYVYQLAAKTNCELPTDAEIIACLRTRPANVIRTASGIECTPGYFCQGYAPIVDGPGGFIPKLPLELREELNDESVVPTIGGICRDDGSLYTLTLVPESGNGGFNSTEFNFYLRRLMSIWAPQVTEEQFEEVFNALRWFYVTWPYLEDLDANREAFNMMITDGAFGYPWDRQMKMISAKNPSTYAYVQSFISNNASSLIPEWMGMPHTGEVAYVWGYGKLLENPAVREDSGIFYDAVGWTEEDIAYSDFQITMWTNFAKYGNPTPEPVKAPFDDTLATWEKFSIDDGLKVFDFDRYVTTHTDFRQQRNAFFYDYISLLVDKPLKKANKPDKPAGNFRFKSETVQQAMRQLVKQTLSARGIEVPDE